MKLPKLDLNITNRCNYRCMHCAFDSGCEQMDELSLDELEKILQDTKDLGGERIDITGGEPTVRKDLVEIIKMGKKLGYKIELVTNGSLLNREKLAHFKELGLDAIAVSLDGSDYETYSRVRKVGKEQYERALQTIEDAIDLGFYTKVNTVVFNCNIDDLPNIAEYCIEKKVDEWGVYYFTPVGRGKWEENEVVDPIRWLDFIRENLAKYDGPIKLTLEFPMIDYEVEGKGCILEEDAYHLQILPDGNVYPCAIMASYHRPVANLKDVSVKDVWGNQKLWEDYAKQVSDVVQCGSCSGNFGLSEEGYQPVCPLRKFRAGEV